MRLSSRHLLAFVLMLVLLPWRGGFGDAMAAPMGGMGAAEPAPFTQAPAAQAPAEATGHDCCDPAAATAAEKAGGCAACHACTGLGPALAPPAATRAAPPGRHPPTGSTAYRSALTAPALKPPIA